MHNLIYLHVLILCSLPRKPLICWYWYIKGIIFTNADCFSCLFLSKGLRHYVFWFVVILLWTLCFVCVYIVRNSMFAVSIFLSVFSLTDHIYVSVCQTKQKQKTFWNLFVQRYITKILINILKVNSDVMHSNKNTESNYFLRGVSYICTVCRFCKNDCKLFLSYKVLNFFFHTTENNWWNYW
jgi:hypothetical protein